MGVTEKQLKRYSARVRRQRRLRRLTLAALALLAVSLLLGLALIGGAHRLGSKLAGRFQGGLTWLSGAILVLLGALRLWM